MEKSLFVVMILCKVRTCTNTTYKREMHLKSSRQFFLLGAVLGI
jgi:hypothetical protein